MSQKLVRRSSLFIYLPVLSGICILIVLAWKSQLSVAHFTHSCFLAVLCLNCRAQLQLHSLNFRGAFMYFPHSDYICNLIIARDFMTAMFLFCSAMKAKCSVCSGFTCSCVWSCLFSFYMLQKRDTICTSNDQVSSNVWCTRVTKPDYS